MRSTREVRRLIASDPALTAILEETEARLSRQNDPGHDLGHQLRVALWTLRLGGDEVDPRAAVAAALLHDAVNPRKDSAESAGASVRSAALARDLLAELDFTAPAIDEVAAAIRDHSYSRGAVPASALGRALQDADRLDALGAVGLSRTLACGVRMGAALYDPADPWARDRPLDDRRFTVDHFFTKLLALPATMNTERGRAEGETRLAPLRRFLVALGREIGVPPPLA